MFKKEMEKEEFSQLIAELKHIIQPTVSEKEPVKIIPTKDFFMGWLTSLLFMADCSPAYISDPVLFKALSYISLYNLVSTLIHILIYPCEYHCTYTIYP